MIRDLESVFGAGINGWQRMNVLWRLSLILLATAVLAACGSAAADAPPTPTLSPEAQLGQQVFSRECGSCHSLSPGAIIVGPSMAGIASRADERVPNQDAHTYLLTSVLNPEAYVVDGFVSQMPANFGKSLTGEELDAVVAFLLTLE